VSDTKVPLVELRDIRVSFGGLHAVDGVTLTLNPGEVSRLPHRAMHALRASK